MLNLAFPDKINEKTQKVFLDPDYKHWSYRIPYNGLDYDTMMFYGYETIKLERWIGTIGEDILGSYKLGYGERTNTVVIQEEKIVVDSLQRIY